MQTPLTPRPGADSSGPEALHVPTEVCENIIDMLYSNTGRDTLHNIAALHSCALVCRAWRVRSQKMLFYKVMLLEVTPLHKFAAVLDDGQHLRDYVHQVSLVGYHLHTTTSIFTLFAAVVSRKLPNLERIDVVHLESPATWCPRPPDPPKFKELPCIPIHPHFPAFLSTFTAVSHLRLEFITFRSFSEFARMLHALPNLEGLTCRSIDWLTPGGSHPGAGFTRQPDWEDGRCTAPPFAPKLRRLQLADMDKYGLERLIWTRGPHLTSLTLTIPLLIVSEEEDNGGVLDLSSCSGLKALHLSLDREFSMEKHTMLVTELLASWKPRCSAPKLALFPYDPSCITRGDFAEVLRGLATITEAWIQTVGPQSGADEHKTRSTARYQLQVRIFDWETKWEWWSNHVDSCFPTFARQRRLKMNFRPPPNEDYEWAAEETPSPSDSVSQPSAVEDVESSSPSANGSESKDAPQETLSQSS